MKNHQIMNDAWNISVLPVSPGNYELNIADDGEQFGAHVNSEELIGILDALPSIDWSASHWAIADALQSLGLENI